MLKADLKLHLQKIKAISVFMALLFVLLFPLNNAAAQEKEEEDTYAISLTKTAEVDKTAKKQVLEVEGRKVLAESHTVQEGEWLWKLFRERGLLKKRNLAELLAILKKLNVSLTDLDQIHPGQKIVIPLTIAPVGGMPVISSRVPEKKVDIASLDDLDLENYTIRLGDSLVKIINERYDNPKAVFYDKYLKMVRRLNPSIKDLNLIHPGEVVRLPVFSPQLVRKTIEPPHKVRMPIKPSAPKPPQITSKEEIPDPLRDSLGRLFTLIGEEWVQTGQHFIPLKRGGEINLKAGSYPIINLSNGLRIIVDMHNDLPEKMAGLIESSWEYYRIVRLKKNDNLRSALSKILPKCEFKRLYESGEAYELEGAIPLRITADWIILPGDDESSGRDRVIMLTLTDDQTPETPESIRKYLAGLGIEAIDFPLKKKPVYEYPFDVKMLNAGSDISAFIETVLNLTGHQFSKKVELPVFKDKKTDFNLVITADFLLKINGNDSIIDLTGLGSDIIPLLRETKFSILSLAGERNLSSILSSTLDFLGVKYASGPHSFMGTSWDDTKEISFTIKGIVFQDRDSRSIFATHLRLPEALKRFLTRKGYELLSLTLS